MPDDAPDFGQLYAHAWNALERLRLLAKAEQESLRKRCPANDSPWWQTAQGETIRGALSILWHAESDIADGMIDHGLDEPPPGIEPTED